MWNVIFLVTGLLFMTLLLFTFAKKDYIKSVENNLFKVLIGLNIFAYFCELPMQIITRAYGIENILIDPMTKLYLIAIFAWFSFFSIYAFVVCINFGKKSFRYALMRNAHLLILLIGVALIVMLPMEKYYDGEKMYAFGQCVDILKLFLGVYMIIWLVLLIKNIKNIKNKKYLPIFIVLILLVVSVIIQTIDPSVLIATMSGTIICYTMYFTIENPDVKMLEEFRIAKTRAEKANEEKEVFVYNITQDIREPLKEIKKAVNWLDENIKNQNVLDAAYYINKQSTAIISLINNVLDISNLEITNIKTYNSKYDMNTIATFIKKTFEKRENDKVEYRVSIDSDIPRSMYGDSIRLKQVFEILIDNAFKNTKEGFVELRISSIQKKDACRLIINIEDSGTGIKPSELEKILDKDNILTNEKIDEGKSTIAMAKSIINLLGGTLLIDSELGRGTKMTIVLDQKIYDEKSLELNKMEKDVSKFIDNTKVMVVVENEEYREKVIKKLSKYELDLEVVELGSKCLDNIRMSKKYDLIIMDESLSHLSSIEIITKLKEIPSFNTPVALLTDNTDNKGYINNGFTYLLDKKIPSKELEDIIDKIERSSK